MRELLWLLVVAGACVGTETTPCPGSDKLCPENTVCIAVTLANQQVQELCVRRDQFAPCDNAAEGAACTFADDIVGTCYGGACLPAACGNLRIDTGEVCDDSENQPGDGCSADCRSTEVCGNGIVDPVELVAGALVPNELCDDRNAVGHDGCSSMCNLETTRWEEVSDRDPPPRGYTVMATDVSRGRIVMFGGSRGGSFVATFSHADSWAWDAGWSPLTVTNGPPARHGHGLAHDPQRRQTVVFGGSSFVLDGKAVVVGDTWILEGERWRPVIPTSAPVARTGHAMAYHPLLGIVLFGGRDASDTALDDTWIWEGDTWRALAVATRPSARAGHSMTFDPVRRVIVLHGGSNGSGETWELDGATWNLASTAGPNRVASALGFDPVQRAVILFGGRDLVNEIGETWSWNGLAWRRLSVAAGPRPRFASGLVNDPSTGELLLFGGLVPADPLCNSCSDVRLGDTWRWTGSVWTELVRSSPEPVSYQVAALDLARGRIVRFGGQRISSGMVGMREDSAETWEYDGTQWYPGAAGPSARSSSAMAYDAARARMVLFGGAGGATLGDTWTWDGMDWAQRIVTPSPPARSSHAMAFDVARGRTVLFGGGTTADTWEWDGVRWIDVTPQTGSPIARSSPSLAYDPIRQRVLMFGGAGPQQISLNDTWEWDGTSWIERHVPISPPPRSRAGMAWDSLRGRMILYGGSDGGARDTWQWDGTTWTLVPLATSPTALFAFALAAAPSGEGVILLGGEDLTVPLSEVWRLRLDSTDPYQTCRTLIDDDGDALAGCADPDCFSRCSPWCPPGVGCAATAPRCGDGVCNRDLEDCRVCADCTCVARCGDWVCDPGEAQCPGDCGP